MVLSMDRWVGKVAVVTGFSSGIGASIAENLVKNGLQLILLIGSCSGEKKRRLEDLPYKLSKEEGKLVPLITDISKEEEILTAFEWIKDNLGPIHILVNNAGISIDNITVLDGDTESWNQLYDVNVLGLCVATREAVKDMRANNVDGHIIHINSVAGHQVYNWPIQTLYASSKFAVRALAENLRMELINVKSKIKVTNVSPDLVDNEILGMSGFRESPKFKKVLEESPILDPQNITDGVLYALSTPPHVQVQEVTIRPIYYNW